MAADRRTVNEFYPITGARSANHPVGITRNDESPARPDRIVVPCLGDLDLDPGVVVEPQANAE